MIFQHYEVIFHYKTILQQIDLNIHVLTRHSIYVQNKNFRNEIKKHRMSGNNTGNFYY